MDENKFTKRHNYRLYPESIKKAVALEYEKTDCSKRYLARKYGLGSVGTVSRWLNEKIDNKEFSKLVTKSKLPMCPSKKSKDSIDKDARIRQLERELEDQKILSEAYRRIIDIAEQDYGISIRKKPDTKQSGK